MIRRILHSLSIVGIALLFVAITATLSIGADFLLGFGASLVMWGIIVLVVVFITAWNSYEEKDDKR